VLRVEHSSRGVVPSVVECTREASPTRDRQVTEKMNETLQYYDGQIKENIFDKTGRPTEELKFDVHKSVHRDTTMKITNKMHSID